MEEVRKQVVLRETDIFSIRNAELEDLANEDTCPDCGMGHLNRAGRCTTCSYCGWSACSL